MFKLVPQSQFGEKELDEQPVWARFDDPDDIEEIVSWGIDRESVMHELNEKHDGSDHACYPVLQTDPLPDSLDLYIRAEFITPGGRRLKGYLVGPEARVIHLFWGNDQFTFSFCGTWLSDLNLAELERMRKAMGDPQVVLFPVTYSTAYKTSEGQPVAGTFSPSLS